MSDSITREEQYLSAIANGESIDLKPITREEQFLAKAAGQNVKVPTPITRKEVFLSKISGAGGGKLEQEKTVEITKNGTTEIFPDKGYTLSRVVANVNVPTASGENKLVPFLQGDATLELTKADLQDLQGLLPYAFANRILKSAELPEHITALPEYCFHFTTAESIKTYGSSFKLCSLSVKSTDEITVNLYLLANDFTIRGQMFYKGASPTEKTINLHFNNEDAYSNFLYAASLYSSNAFQNCGPSAIYFGEDLATELNISSKLTTFGKATLFRSVEEVRKIKFLGNINSIPDFSFYGCSSLEEVDFTACTAVPTLGGISSFSGVKDNCQIKVPAALYDEWISATNWSNSSIARRIVAV
jgi:hypothetical protein